MSDMSTSAESMIPVLSPDEVEQGLSPETYQRFKEQGILRVNHFLTPEDFQSVQEDLHQRMALLESRYGVNPPSIGSSQDLTTIGQRIIALERDFPGSHAILYDAMSHSPSVHALSVHPKLLFLLKQLLSSSISLHHREILLMSLPKHEWHLATWHQDWYYNHGPYSTLTLYAPLQRTTSENGGLMFALGEHVQGPFPHGEYNHGIESKWLSLSPETVSQFQCVVSPELDPGDILLFNSLVPHSPRVNHSSQIRFVLNLRYHDLSDPDFLQDLWRIEENQDARTALRRPLKSTSLQMVSPTQ